MSLHDAYEEAAAENLSPGLDQGLAEQYRMLNSLPAQYFRDVAHLASVICGTPIAYVSLLEGKRQRVKASVGMDFSAQESSEAFSAQTVTLGTTLVVPDARLDARFKDNAFILGEPFIRFYAGTPILTPGGSVVGTVCVLDTQPHELTAAQIEGLEILARRILGTLTLEQQRAHQEKGRAEALELAEKLALATNAASLGIYTWQPDTDTVHWENDRIYEILGRTRSQGPLNAATFHREIVIPEHALSFQQALDRTVSMGEPFAWEGKFLHGSGEQRWLSFTGRLLPAGAGSWRRILGTVADTTDVKSADTELRSAEERLRLAQSAAGIVTWELNLITGALQWTGDPVIIYGRPTAQLGHVQEAISHILPEDRETLSEAIARANSNGAEFRTEFRTLWPDGSIHWVDARGVAFTDGHESVVRLLGVNRDVTSAALARQALESSEARANRILASIGDAVIVTDAANRVTRMNVVAERLTRWPEAEARGQLLNDIFRIVNEGSRQTVESPGDKVARLGTVVGLASHTILIGKDGSEAFIDDSGAPILNDAGELLGVVVIFRDVTDRRRAEWSLELLARTGRILGEVRDGRQILEEIGRAANIHFADIAVFDLLLPTGEFERTVGRHRVASMQASMDRLLKFVPGRDSVNYPARIALQLGSPVLVRTFTDADLQGAALNPEHLDYLRQELKPRSLLAVPLIVEGQALGAVTFIRNVTGLPFTDEDRETAEELGARLALALRYAHAAAALKRSEERFRLLIERANVGLAIGDTEGRLMFLNPALRKLLGYTEQDVQSGSVRWDDLTPPRYQAADAHAIEQLVQCGVADPYEKEYRARDGRFVPILVGASVVPSGTEDGGLDDIAVIVTDLSMQKRAEAALVHTEKLAAVGKLASSISHEINNPLEAVTNLLYIVRLDKTLTQETRDFLDSADRELMRVSQVVSQTLRFHRQSTAAQKVKPEVLLEEVRQLYSARLLNAGVIIKREYKPDVTVTCYEGDIRQVLNNLVGNATDAMRQGGTLTLRTRNATRWSTGAKGIRITVADTGVGMTPEVYAHIFDAFYTTKGINGTGLGLWISCRIVHKHRGYLRAYSTTGGARQGTVFSVWLPLALAESARESWHDDDPG